MKRIFRSIPKRVLTADTEWLLSVQLRHSVLPLQYIYWGLWGLVVFLLLWLSGMVTYIDSGHPGWLVGHSSYTKRRGVEKSLHIHRQLLGLDNKNLCCVLHSVSSNFQSSCSKHSHFSIPLKRLFSPSSPTLHCSCWKVVSGMKILSARGTRLH